MKKSIYTFGIIIIVIFWVSYNFWDINNPRKFDKAIKYEEQLKTEFSKIGSLPDANLKEPISEYKENLALVGAEYIISSNYDTIYKFYDKEFRKNGWEYVKTENMYDWGKSYGGKILHYRKSELELTLEYSGDETHYGWTYAVELSWKSK